MVLEGGGIMVFQPADEDIVIDGKAPTPSPPPIVICPVRALCVPDKDRGDLQESPDSDGGEEIRSSGRVVGNLSTQPTIKECEKAKGTKAVPLLSRGELKKLGSLDDRRDGLLDVITALSNHLYFHLEGPLGGLSRELDALQKQPSPDQGEIRAVEKELERANRRVNNLKAEVKTKKQVLEAVKKDYDSLLEKGLKAFEAFKQKCKKQHGIEW